MSENEKEESGGRKPLVYRDFNLRFGGYDTSNGSFKVWVEGETPGGAMKPDNAASLVYDPKAFWDDPETGTGGSLGKLERRQLPEAEILKLGTMLRDLALPEGEVRALFDKSMRAVGNAGQGLRLRLRIDPVALVHLPWEFMASPRTSGDPQETDFFALRREISIARTDTVEAAVRDLPNRSSIRLVLVLSSPTGQDELDMDARLGEPILAC